MKPLSIEMQNFGAIAAATIDVSQIACAAICGPNGAGKSTAFTIAPMFALFGMTKAGTGADDMVRAGENMATVTFDFEHHGSIWRVIRTRSKQGRGKSTLDLQRQSGELWVSESGASIAETQKRIVNLLGLDADTFAASSMILQGDAGNFTKRPAGQRKAILAQILQLDQYDHLQEKSREKVTQLNLEIERLKIKQGEIDTRLYFKPELLTELDACEKQCKGIEELLPQQEGSLQKLQIEYEKLLNGQQEKEETTKQLQQLRDQTIVKKQDLDNERQREKIAQSILDKKEDILRAATAYDAIKIQITALNAKKDEKALLFAEAKQQKQDLDNLLLANMQTATDISVLTAAAADRQQIENAKNEYDTLLNQHNDLLSLREQYRKHSDIVRDLQARLKEESDRNQSRMDKLKGDLKNLEVKADMLERAECVDIEKANCRFLRDAIIANNELPAVKALLETEQTEHLKKKTELDGQIDVAHKELLSLKYDPLAITETEQRIGELKPQVDKLAQLQAKLPLLDNLQNQLTDGEKRAQVLQERIQVMRDKWRVLSEGMEQLPTLEKKRDELAAEAAQKEQLPVAQEAIVAAQARITSLTDELQQLQVNVATLEAKIKAIQENTSSINVKEESIHKLRETLQTSRTQQIQLIGRIGGIKAKLDALAEDETAKKELQASMPPLALRYTRYKTLMRAFGRDGIPALIIENAVPELERIANDILGQMSAEKNYLRFETQKELKSKKGMAETLDIIVGDWAGERIYETYSGGEQLRIDFAIRFALAELLARRAGSKVDWLTIDEGFGSQSDEFLPMVIEAVQNIADRFGRVLVISHVKAVQEAFAERIEFVPSTAENGITQVHVR